MTHVDFSSDGQYLQSNCGAYELLFSSVMDGKQITSATELRDVKWDSWTVPLGWASQGELNGCRACTDILTLTLTQPPTLITLYYTPPGIWSGSQDGSDINAVDRSNSGHLLATGDDDASVKLYKFPSCDDNAESITYKVGYLVHWHTRVMNLYSAPDLNTNTAYTAHTYTPRAMRRT